MADKKILHKNTLRLQKFTHQKLQYMLLNSLGEQGKYVDIKAGDEIKIADDHKVLIIRYEYKNKHTDGFQIKEITGGVRLVGYQFRMEREQGTLWSINVFKIEDGTTSNKRIADNHDSDIEPPKPPIPS